VSIIHDLVVFPVEPTPATADQTPCLASQLIFGRMGSKSAAIGFADCRVARTPSSRRTIVNSLKTLLGATLLAALAYGVYVGITKKPGATTKVDGPKIEPGVLTKHDLPPHPVERADSQLAGAEAPAFDAAAPSMLAPPARESRRRKG
jgi:hypothetical protein